MPKFLISEENENGYTKDLGTYNLSSIFHAVVFALDTFLDVPLDEEVGIEMTDLDYVLFEYENDGIEWALWIQEIEEV